MCVADRGRWDFDPALIPPQQYSLNADYKRGRPQAEADAAAGVAQQQEFEVGGDGRRLNVYAKDQRVLFNWDVYPDRVFGKLMFPASYYCTGQLIGKRYVLTAAHCFYSYGKQVRVQLRYRLAGTVETTECDCHRTARPD